MSSGLGESPLLDSLERKTAVRERRIAQLFKDITNTLESDVESMPDESSEGAWFAPQPEIEVCAEAGPSDWHVLVCDA